MCFQSVEDADDECAQSRDRASDEENGLVSYRVMRISLARIQEVEEGRGVGTEADDSG